MEDLADEPVERHQLLVERHDVEARCELGVEGRQDRGAVTQLGLELCGVERLATSSEIGHRLGELLHSWRQLVRGSDIALVSLLLDSAQWSDVPAHEFLEKLGGIGLDEALAESSRGEDRIEVNRMQEHLVGANLTLGELADRARALDRVYVTTMTAR